MVSQSVFCNLVQERNKFLMKFADENEELSTCHLCKNTGKKYQEENYV